MSLASESSIYVIFRVPILMYCSPASDQVFGPRVDVLCRSFDFTLKFEDTIFACVPAAIFLCMLPSNLIALLRRPCIYPLSSRLLACRMTVLVGILAAQLGFLVLRSQSIAVQTSASLAADISCLITTGTLLVLSVINHQRSLRSSSLISVYLSAYTILGIARARTLWLISSGEPIPATVVTILALTVVALIAESVKRSAKAEPGNQQYSPEQYSGFWNRAIWAWLAAIFRLGYAKVISVDDLPHLDSKLESHQTHQKLLLTWDKYNRHDRYSLLRACFRSYLPSLLSPIIPRLCLSAFTFLQPFLLNSTVSLVEQSNPNKDYGKGLIGAWALVFMGIAVSNSVFQYQSFRFVTRVRGSLMALVYQQSLQIREAEQGKVTAMAILGADVPQIVASLTLFHEVWAALLDVAIASWLLERNLSLGFLAPVVLILIFIGITSKISATANTSQRRWIEKIQERLRATTHLLENLKAVKMLGLTRTMSTNIQNLRRDEIKASTSYRKVLLRIILLSNVPLNLAPTVTFAVYALISVYWKGSALEVSQAFTSLALISLLTTPVMLFTQTLPRVIQGLGCFDRVQEYCNYGADKLKSENPSAKGHKITDNVEMDRLSKDVTREAIELSSKAPLSGQSILLSGESFQWKEDGPIVLKNLNLSLEPGTFTALVGAVGSGKSTLLESILGETITQPQLLQKKLSISVSYCSQIPWLENKTIRDSIIGESTYNDNWYETVKAACNLETDITRQAQGDLTRIGSKGISLSGGQKQRIALARAVYARSGVIILDDVFSGMDAHTVDIVSHRLLQPDGLLRRYHATIILATTNRKIIALADNVIALKDGEIVDNGKPQDLLAADGYVSKLGQKMPSEIPAEELWENEESKPRVERTKEKISISNDQQRKKGELSVYLFYFANSGYLFLCGNLLSVVAWMFLTEFSTIWLKWWSEDSEAYPNKRIGMYCSIYAMFGVLGTFFACIAGWFLLVRMISRSADRLHFRLLEAMLKAPFWFLTATDTGELMNRFSQDMELVDMSLPATISSYITSAVQCLVKLIILLVFSRYLGVAVPLLASVVFFLQRFYLRTSRQVRLLGIEAKAPLYSHFMDSVSGAVTIRSFGWQSAYQKHIYRLIDTFQRPEYLQSCIQHWLTFILDTIVAILAVILVATIVTWQDKFDPGSVGVSLVMIIGFSTTLMRVIKSWTSMESSISAIARIKRFVDETETEDRVDSNEDLDLDWLKTGSLQIEKLEVSHSPYGEIVLKNVSLIVEPKQHIAICGRSGSGKTSLILSILQMMVLRNGHIKIDGIDITSLHCDRLRRAINVVPQDPFLMPGTVRLNADPFGLVSDDEIMRVLTRVGLWDVIFDQGGLDKDMNTSAWSVGQKQLFCLARAMTNKRSILILDEAMSSVDNETETLMQEIIDTEFKHTTVLAIMHRLDHITKYDKVALLDQGELVEFNTLSKLTIQGSRSAELWKSSNSK